MCFVLCLCVCGSACSFCFFCVAYCHLFFCVCCLKVIKCMILRSGISYNVIIIAPWV